VFTETYRGLCQEVWNPKVTPLAALLAAVALSVYMVVVLFYYLRTVRIAQDVNRLQFEDHVRSFKDVLGEKETKDLLENKRVQQAWRDFRTRRYWANGIYGFLLIASLSAGVYYGRQLATRPAASKVSQRATTGIKVDAETNPHPWAFGSAESSACAEPLRIKQKLNALRSTFKEFSEREHGQSNSAAPRCGELAKALPSPL
jgi:hypothetical protein